MSLRNVANIPRFRRMMAERRDFQTMVEQRLSSSRSPNREGASATSETESKAQIEISAAAIRKKVLCYYPSLS